MLPTYLVKVLAKELKQNGVAKVKVPVTEVEAAFAEQQN